MPCVCICAVHMHASCHLLLLLTRSDDRRTALASPSHRAWSVCTRSLRLHRRTDRRSAATRAHECCRHAAAHRPNCPFLPTQVTLYSLPSPSAAAARRPASSGALPFPAPPSPASPPPAEAARARFVFLIEPEMHMHMHASAHLITYTNMSASGCTLHQPHSLSSPDSREPACHTPQAFRPPEGRRSTATKRC